MGGFLQATGLAAISALAYLAYNHPTGYKKIAEPLKYITIYLVTVFSITLLVSTTVNIFRLKQRLQSFPTKPISDSSEIIEDLFFPYTDNFWYIFTATVALLIYLIFLEKLPAILAEPSHDNKKQPENTPKDNTKN